MSEERRYLARGGEVACEFYHACFPLANNGRNPLQNNDDAKVILASAVQHVGQSVKIWMAASDLEHDVKAKKRVLRKGTENSCHEHASH